jgi:hypothetical protein
MNRVKVQTLKKLPLLIRRQQRVVHKLLERLEALHIDPHCVFVALLGAVKRILLGVADTPEKTHGSLVPPVRGLFLGGLIATSYLSRLCLALVARVVGDEMRWVTVAENGESFVEAGLLYEAVTGEVAT